MQPDIRSQLLLCFSLLCCNITFYGKLGEIEPELPDTFIRCHNRYLVNLNHVTRLENTSLLCGGDKIAVSRSCAQETAAAFARFMLR